MDLAEQILRQIDSPSLGQTEKARLRCQLAKELTERGKYEEARDVMKPLWGGIGTRPVLDNLDGIVAAEVLLRAGILCGAIGSMRQIERVQETAKDLISESKRIFEELGADEKVAEAQSALAVCYWREGAFDEARVLLRQVLDQCSHNHIEQRARAYLNSTLVEVSTMRFNEALSLLTAAGPLLDKIDNHLFKGNFRFQLALVLRKLSALEQRADYMDRAIVEYAAASYHYGQADHKNYRARVENNLAFLLFTIGNFPEAHTHLDRAQRLFTTLKDNESIAHVNETRARVFLAEGRNTEAEKAVRTAVRTLERGDELSLFAQALTTHGVTLARLGRVVEARSALERAIEVAEQVGDNYSAGLAALTLMEELGELLALDDLRSFYDRADRLLVDSQDTKMLERLRACARRVVNVGQVSLAESRQPLYLHADERTAGLLRTVHVIAATQGAVLITGEDGTGKEVLARLIHVWSGRTGQFVSINCRALTEALTESQLFGHLRGSFVNALQDQAGAVREAAGGTLFLDGIAELSSGNQGKLLRLIEHGEIHPIGAPLPEHVEVRIIASASCDLMEQVARKKFRDDLFYRLNTFHLAVPPLRERPADIIPLARHFIEEFVELHGKSLSFTPEALEAMRGLQLKNNARELRTLIECTMLAAKDGAVITAEAVQTLAARRSDIANLSNPWDGCSIKDEVLIFESRLIRQALENARGSVTHAARLLGITHQRLCAMLQGRHKNLLLAKKATRPRKRSIITKLRA